VRGVALGAGVARADKNLWGDGGENNKRWRTVSQKWKRQIYNRSGLIAKPPKLHVSPLQNCNRSGREL